MTSKFYVKEGRFSSADSSSIDLGGKILFIGHSPPSGSELLDGSTRGKIDAIGSLLRAQRYVIVNLFADIACYSNNIKGNDPTKVMDEENLRTIVAEAENAGKIILAWGSRGTIHKRNRLVLSRLLVAGVNQLYHVGPLTKNRQPRHFRGWDTKASSFTLSEYPVNLLEVGEKPTDQNQAHSVG